MHAAWWSMQHAVIPSYCIIFTLTAQVKCLILFSFLEKEMVEERFWIFPLKCKWSSCCRTGRKRNHETERISVSDWYLVVKLADQPLAVQSIPLVARERAGRILTWSGWVKVEYFTSEAAYCWQTPGVISEPWADWSDLLWLEAKG